MIKFEREFWGAKYDRGDYNDLVKSIVLAHHFAEPHVECNVGVEAEARIMRNVEHFHVTDPQRQFRGIGYNWVVFPSGNVYEGRGWDRRGAHEERVNSVSVGIAIAMNAQEHEPTGSSLRAFREIVREGMFRGHIHEGARIMGHRDFDPVTECPGDHLYNRLEELHPNYDNDCA